MLIFIYDSLREFDLSNILSKIGLRFTDSPFEFHPSNQSLDTLSATPPLPPGFGTFGKIIAMMSVV